MNISVESFSVMNFSAKIFSMTNISVEKFREKGRTCDGLAFIVNGKNSGFSSHFKTVG